MGSLEVEGFRGSDVRPHRIAEVLQDHRSTLLFTHSFTHSLIIPPSIHAQQGKMPFLVQLSLPHVALFHPGHNFKGQDHYPTISRFWNLRPAGTLCVLYPVPRCPEPWVLG